MSSTSPTRCYNSLYSKKALAGTWTDDICHLLDPGVIEGRTDVKYAGNHYIGLLPDIISLLAHVA